VNGPEHYAKAETLLGQVKDSLPGPSKTATIAEAAVHAQLAQVSATFDVALGHRSTGVQKWRKVLGWDKLT
jgi:hypothetical protein